MAATTPFILPEGNVQISLSGGRTSAYMLARIMDANPGAVQDESRVQVVFCNTGRERPETLDFVAEIGRRWQVPIVWIEFQQGAPGQRFRVVGRQGASLDGEPFRDLIFWRSFMPHATARFCTSELKVRPARDYLRSIGWTHWTAAVGFRADEAHRDESTAVARERWTRWCPMIEAETTKRDVIAFWQDQPFDLGLSSDGRTPLGNCDGCMLKSERVLSALARDEPDRHAWWEDMERVLTERWWSLTPWARLRRIIASDQYKTVKDKTAPRLRAAYGRPIPKSVLLQVADRPRTMSFSKRVSRRAIRETVERQGDWIFSAEADGLGVLCQVDGGECIE